MVFTTAVLITGPLWGRPVWGVYWTWDPRLTSFLLLWLIYLSYLVLRGYVPEPERRARYSAVVGIVGFLDVPIVYLSVRWWRAQHPSQLIFTRGGLPTSMLVVLLIGVGRVHPPLSLPALGAPPRDPARARSRGGAGMSGTGYLIAAYVGAAALYGGYVATLWRRERDLGRRGSPWLSSDASRC